MGNNAHDHVKSCLLGSSSTCLPQLHHGLFVANFAQIQNKLLGNKPPAMEELNLTSQNWVTSRQAEEYSRVRPKYPDSLFAFLVSLTASHKVAWDVGTGNGQAAVAISESFEKVIATDVAAEQLKHATRRPNITYTLTPPTLTRDELAHIVGHEGSVDLVIVTEALHWFDLESFYENVKHVLRKPGGVFAAVAYKLRPQVSEPVNKVLDELYSEMEWSPRVGWVEDEYKTIPFPFAPLVPQAASDNCSTGIEDSFELTMDANLDEFLRYIETWSGTQTAMAKGLDPLNETRRRSFHEAWGSPEIVRCLRWPLVVCVGTVPT